VIDTQPEIVVDNTAGADASMQQRRCQGWAVFDEPRDALYLLQR
jgi:hypothetical protein